MQQSQTKLEQSLLYQIAITQIPNVGDVLAKNLISYCGGVEDVFKQKKQKLLRVPGIGEKAAQSIIDFNNFSRIEEEVDFIMRNQIKTHFYLDNSYSWRLKHIADAPCMLYQQGNANLNNEKIIGIVGTRKSTIYGKHFVDELTELLSDTGCLVVSGLALGIDIQSHRAALKHHLPTVGVLAHGLDRIYPFEHIHTANKMTENGGLLTEYMSQTIPDKENFPTRNRIVAGMCDILLVVESGLKGGAMITADLANGYNKDVMAVPGRVGDLYSAGCNYLIKHNKAAIVTQPKDVLEWMGWSKSKTKVLNIQPQLPLDLTDTELQVVNYLRQKTKAGIDNMSFELKMNQPTLSSLLLGLEMQGLVRTLPGKQYELS
jgi:DNA processing protein